MRIEFDPQRDLLYLWLVDEDANAARTETIAAGVMADFDSSDRLIGLEFVEASRVVGKDLKVQLSLSSS